MHGLASDAAAPIHTGAACCRSRSCVCTTDLKVVTVAVKLQVDAVLLDCMFACLLQDYDLCCVLVRTSACGLRDTKQLIPQRVASASFAAGVWVARHRTGSFTAE